jgi:prepilin-type N-terminal cleavage/methylation domain-containing protein
MTDPLQRMREMRRQAGFTLIEIAIVLVIIGLLLGGVLKGQELITSARVRNLASHQDGVKAAYFGFLDRYRALPGDYQTVNAVGNIPGCAACLGGNADGQISGADEPQIAWEHLSKAGFITGSYAYPAIGAGAAVTNTPTNPYGSFTQLIFDNVYQDPASPVPNRHNLKTGANIPSDILAEVDRKVDDGLATTGQMRYSAFGGAAAIGVCSITPGSGAWQSANPNANCGGTLLF